MNAQSRNAAARTICAGLFGALALSTGGQAQTTQTKVTGSGSNPFDRLGTVTLEGDYFLAGTPGDSTLGLNTGAVYVFERNLGGAGNWGERTKITASNPTNAAGFGTDVSLSGARAFIGAPFESGSGALYIHERNLNGMINSWGQLKHITAPVGQTNDAFGNSVSATGTRVLVGSPEVFASNTGRAYIYEQNLPVFNNWGLLKTLQATPPVVRESFGEAVALDTSTCVVGAIGNDSLTTNAGAAYVFERNQGGADNWGQVAQLLPSSPFPSGFFGMKVAISGDYAFVGAPGEDFGRGAVYVFWRHQGGVGAWGEQMRIAGPTPGGAFGSAVSVFFNRALIGEEHGPDGGSVYLLEQGWGGAPWGIMKRINANNFGPQDEFGSDVELDAFEGVVGAPRTTVGGSTFAGAGYLLDIQQTITAMPYGFCHTGAPCGNLDPDAGCANSSGSGALLSASGSSSVTLDDLVLTTTQMPPNTAGLHFMGPTQVRTFLGDGLLVTGGPIIRLYPGLNSGPAGQWTFGPGLAGTYGIQPGVTWNFQTWFRDNNGPCGNGTNVSNGMSVSFRP